MFRKLPLALMSRFVASVKRLSSIALVFASAIALVVPSGGAQAGVIDPDDPTKWVDGKPQSAWTADWWQWAMSFPFASSPMFDGDGSRAGYGNTGPVFFVAGAFGGDYTRKFNVPAGKPLFVPVVNAIAFQTLATDTEADLRALAAPTNVFAMWATVNGTSLNAQLLNHRQQSPLFKLSSPLLADFGFCWNDSTEDPTCSNPPVYQDGDAVSDGYWLMLEPLSLGQTYDVVVGGIFQDGSELNITANITAVPEPSTMALLAGGVVSLFGIRRRTLRTAAGTAS
jgi:hypothetical protein